MADHKHTPQRRSSKGKVCHIRSLKVRAGSTCRIIKDKHHAHFDKTVYLSVPWINIQGQWLEQAGFVIHTPITVRVMEGCLVLTAQPGEKSSS
jgi:hypothetical protein